MVIAFGIRSFKIKEFEPAEVGLAGRLKGYKVQLRQTYFHLFFIPFIASGKKLALSQRGKLYDMPYEYETIINAQRIKVKIPWHVYVRAFAGPILILLFILGLLSTVPLQHYVSYRAKQREIKETYNRLNDPQKNDYYFFCDSMANCYTLKVDSVTPASVQFIAPRPSKTNHFQASVSAQQLEDSIHNTIKIWVNRDTLQRTYGGEKKYNLSFKGYPVSALSQLLKGNVKLFRITRRAGRRFR